MRCILTHHFFPKRFKSVESLLQYAQVLHLNGDFIKTLSELDKLDLEIEKMVEISPKFVKSRVLAIKSHIILSQSQQKRKIMMPDWQLTRRRWKSIVFQKTLLV